MRVGAIDGGVVSGSNIVPTEDIKCSKLDLKVESEVVVVNGNKVAVVLGMLLVGFEGSFDGENIEGKNAGNTLVAVKLKKCNVGDIDG